MDSIVRQRLLLDLLSHFSDGNFATFDRLACKAWQVETRNTTTQNLVHNQLQACHMGGLVDSFETETSLRWSANLDDSGTVHSNRPKKIWRGTNIDGELTPLVVDELKNVLLLGYMPIAQPKPRSAFHFTPTEFFRSLPSLVSLSNEYVRREKWKSAEQCDVELFDPSHTSWSTVPLQGISESGLIRIRGDFSGRSYFVIIPDLHILFRIANPEWSHLLAGTFLGWSFKNLFRFDGNTMRVNSRLKLPGLIRRFLFANASLVRCGSITEFNDFCPISYTALLNYFGGSEYE